MAARDSMNGLTEAQLGAAALPPSRAAWPTTAQQAFRHTLSELNSWCRDIGWPPGNNAWIAETAVREAWAAAPVTVENDDRLAA